MKWSNRVFANILGIFLVIGFFSFSFQFGWSAFQPFVKETEIESHNYAWDVIGTPSGGVYTGGNSFSRSNILSWDANGELNWDKFIEIIPYWEGETDGYGSRIIDMQIDDEGNLNTITYIWNLKDPNFDDCYLIQKLDENGSEIWKTEIFGDFENSIEPIILLNNEGDLYLTINENKGLNVMKLDSLGEIVWNNTYTEKNVYTLHSSAAIDNNNSIYIVGIYRGGGGIFLKINSSGSLIFNNTYEEHFLQGIVLGENDSIYTIGKLNDGETDLNVEFIKWNSDGILLEIIYWNITKPNFEVRSYLCDMQISEDNKIFALVGLFYSRPYQDQSEQDIIVWDLDTQTIQNKTIVNESEIDEIWLTSFLIDSENNLYTAGKANASVLLSKWDQSFNKIWQKTWNADSRVQLSYPYLENAGDMYFVISAVLLAFYFVGINIFLKKHRTHL